jgi:acetyl esterase/lipase
MRILKRPLVWLLLLALASLILLRAQHKSDLIEETDIHYGSAQDVALVLDVLRQPAANPRPAILFIHGGGWKGGDKNDFWTLGEGFARRGYVCILVNYRLVTDTANRFPVPVNDVQHAVRWVRANATRYGVDPQRIGALGASAGGHLVALLGTTDTFDNQPPELSRYSSRVRCVVDLFGPTDLTRAFPVTRELDVQKLVHDFLGGTSQEKPEAYRAASPYMHIDRATVPFLIIQGVRDPLVPVEQSRIFAQKLRENNVPVTYVEFPEEGHGVEKPEDKARFVTATTEFFDLYLKR